MITDSTTKQPHLPTETSTTGKGSALKLTAVLCAWLGPGWGFRTPRMGIRRSVLSSFSPGNAQGPCPVQIKNGWAKRRPWLQPPCPRSQIVSPSDCWGRGTGRLSLPRIDSTLLSSITLTTRFPQKYLITQWIHNSSSPKQWSPLLIFISPELTATTDTAVSSLKHSPAPLLLFPLHPRPFPVCPSP